MTIRLTAENESPVPMMYSSFGRRLMAFLIDAIIFAVPAAIFNSIIPVAGGMIAWFFYGPVLEASVIRATLGKYLMGIQVTDEMGRRITIRASIIRNLLKFVSTAIMFIGYLIALFTAKKQSLHDLLADTVVIYGRNETSIADAWIEESKEILNIGQNPTVTSNTSSTSKSNVVSELERLSKLRDMLTEDEFQAAKRKILNEDNRT